MRRNPNRQGVRRSFLQNLLLVLLPFLWLAAWIFCRVLAAHRLVLAFAAAAIALAVLLAPALLAPIEWTLPTLGLALGYLVAFPALVAVVGRASA